MVKSFTILAGVFFISGLLFWYCSTRSQVNEKEFLGYWYGTLPANPGVEVVLYFFKSDDDVRGKAFFTEGENINSENPIHNVVLSGSKIDFDIPAQGTHYSGKISLPDIKGGFDTPGNPFLKFSFIKTELEKLASAEAIRRAGKPFNLNQTFTLDQLKEDFSILRRAIWSHPQIYLYSSEDEMNDYFSTAENKLYDGMKIIDFIRVVAPVIADLKCYHTQLIIPEKIRNAFVNDAKSIPLDIVYVDNNAYVRKSLVGDPEIEPGSEVLEINGRPAGEILRMLALNISADGNNTSHKIEEINKNFWLLYNFIESPDNYTLKIKQPWTGKMTDVSVSAITGEKILKALNSDRPGAKETASNPVPVALSISNDTGILKVTSFMYSDPDRYKEKLAAYFDEINDKRVRYLIVDLRGNTGGYPVLAADLFGYFIRKPTAFLSEPRNDSHYSGLLKPERPKDNGYNGVVYFLSDGNSLSSTGLFLALVKYNKLGKIAGDIPGGSFTCSDDGKRWNLPNSKIQFTVPHTTFTAAVEGFKKGDQVRPDFLVKPTVADLIEHKDVTMAYVQDMIHKK